MCFEPVLELGQAADEPGRADAKAFEQYMAEQDSDLIAESDTFNQGSADDWAAREGVNTEPATEA
jgi:hypothetical protein